jgi:hypothetical protein
VPLSVVERLKTLSFKEMNLNKDEEIFEELV